MVTKENDQAFLPTANILQLNYVSSVCAEFLEKQLDTSNCIDIKAFADLHNYTDLFSSSEAYIKQHFLDVAKGEHFLFLSSEDLVKLISSNDFAVPFEEKDCFILMVTFTTINCHVNTNKSTDCLFCGTYIQALLL